MSPEKYKSLITDLDLMRKEVDNVKNILESHERINQQLHEALAEVITHNRALHEIAASSMTQEARLKMLEVFYKESK